MVQVSFQQIVSPVMPVEAISLTQKGLSQTDLKSFLANYNSDHEAAIATQVSNGAGPMPSFKGALTSSEITEVTTYVESMSSKGWC